MIMSFDEISNTNLGLSLDLGLGFHEHHQIENFMKKKEDDNDPSKCNFNKSYALSLTLGPIIIDDDDDQQQQEASKIEASSNYSPSDEVSNSFSNNNSSSIIKKEKSEEFEVEVEDIEDGNPRKKLRLSKEQSAILEENFKEHSTLNLKQKQELAKKLNLRARQVEVWFQNRRARTKLKQTESDCEILRKCCKTLTEENKKLQKELQELRSIQTTGPFCMKMIPAAATFTICPSCERNSIIHASSSSSSTPNTTTFLISGSNSHNHNHYHRLYKSNNYPFSHPSSSAAC